MGLPPRSGRVGVGERFGLALVDVDRLVQPSQLEDLAVVVGQPLGDAPVPPGGGGAPAPGATRRSRGRLARTSSITSIPMPPLFMYSRALKLSTMVRVNSP